MLSGEIHPIGNEITVALKLELVVLLRLSK